MLFSDADRTDPSPALESESMYGYLQRSSTLEAGRVRELVESILRLYPRPEDPDIEARLTSTDDRQHISAFYEIYISYILRWLRYKVTVHPDMRNTARHPDFKASKALRRSLLLEVTTAFHESLEEEAASKRADVVYDALNRMDSPDYWLGIEVRGAPATPPPASILRTRLSRWLEELDWSSLRQKLENRDGKASPVFLYDHDGWSLRIRAIPKPPQLRGQPGVRPIGIRSGAFCFSNAREAMRRAVLDKATAYGSHRYPFVIAVNCFGIHTDHEDIIEALFGSLSHTVQIDGSSRPIATRNLDGIWIGPNGPQNHHVCAILANIRLSPWSVSRSAPTLYLNPMAKYKLRGPITKLNSVSVCGGQIVRKPGAGPGELFKVWPSWPESESAA